MARGAPDHIRLSDDAHSRYTWRWLQEAGIISASGTLYTLIDEKFEGVLISFSILCRYRACRFRIYVDDIEILDFRPETVFNSYHFRHPGAGLDIVGLSIYDDVNLKYALWFQTHYKCYVKKSVKITGWQGSGAPVQMFYPLMFYLERI